ncbi:HupE/UreJ family protein [Methyloversatilis sp. XJ19-49]|uniref:HupE/UreJ family protein n=1 Tax=Methyloversatilis sp. XJ19-49 TaxID=2963429 RepID=UPI00211D0BA2|nr:HupE/UreJ family protein [Methyloversatilis sp. XJ19-49]MCQ9379152.1 HupE/UreJ family protein [Methyloversatilis sp. XJ19-49]
MKKAWTGALATGLAVFAAPARAHLASTGFGDFYDGIAHVLITPEDLLVVIAAALLAGQRGTAAARLAALALPLAWLVGGLVGTRWQLMATQPLLTTSTFALAGMMVALDRRLHVAVVVAVAVVAGLLHGLANGPTMTPAGIGVQGLVGAISAVCVLTLLLSSQIAALTRDWHRIAVRVAGSWIAASGLLMFGWLYQSAA